MTRPLSSSNDVFLLDFARLFVYLTALEQEITTLALVIAFLEADVPIDDFITRASPHDETRRYARKTAIHGDMRTSDATANSPSGRNPMKSVRHLFVPSLTGCVLVASWSLAAQLSPVPWQGLEQTGHRGPPRGHPPASSRGHIGMASWDGRYWQGRPTASGARSDRSQRTAAHRTAPLGTQAVVTTLAHGYVVRVQLTDRGPHTRQRVLDLSYEAVRRLAMVRTGAARVKVALLAAALPLASLPGMPSTASPGRGRATLAWQRRRASSGRPAAGSYTPAPAGTRPVGRWGAPVCGPSTPPRPHRVLRSHTASHGRRPEPITRGRGERP